ncbi:MAG: hypothetical protein VR70_10745 [Rhodospirillaceae bacterium BRH_c57]|nr:MAG: hypothetical protein VR70_10745 [Rhodospirillaceae bacterium BRH_c57]
MGAAKDTDKVSGGAVRRLDAAYYAELDRIALEEWSTESSRVLRGLLKMSVKKRIAVAARNRYVECLTPEDAAIYEKRLSIDSRREGASSAFEKGKGFYAEAVGALKKGVATLRPGDDVPKDPIPKALFYAWVAIDEFVILLPREIATKASVWTVEKSRMLRPAIPVIASIMGAVFMGDLGQSAGLNMHPDLVSDFGTLAGGLGGAVITMWLDERRRAQWAKIGKQTPAEAELGKASDKIWIGLGLGFSAWLASLGLYAWPIPYLVWTMALGGFVLMAWGTYRHLKEALKNGGA